MHKTTHSVMFHHFHDEKHLPSQGSLSDSEFVKMIDWLNKHYRILSASEYKKSFESNNLKKTDICLSFDDALKCQYDIAVPIMERLGIEAFFFVYSSAFGAEPDPLEIYRFFRTKYFKKIDEFYECFFEIVEEKNAAEFSRHRSEYLKLDYLSSFSFYTENDKWFRYLRDNFLVGEQYKEIMNDIMDNRSFDIDLAKKDLWMSETDLVRIESKGHIIGLHGYSHPTRISKLSRAQQKSEYKKNYDHLSKLLGKPIDVMSHPCGDYNKTTLNILKEMNIHMGFRSNMSVKDILSPLEIPREDHANVYKEMNQ